MRFNCHPWLFVILVLSYFVLGGPLILFSQGECDKSLRELEQKKKLLVEYEEALQKFLKEKDEKLLSVLRHKVVDLSQQIMVLEAAVANCPGVRKSAVGEGLSSIKSDEEKYATKSCGDLRRMLVQLIRKINSLKRREASLFSDLNPLERSELRDANEELALVKSILKARCADIPVTSPFRYNPRPSTIR